MPRTAGRVTIPCLASRDGKVRSRPSAPAAAAVGGGGAGSTDWAATTDRPAAVSHHDRSPGSCGPPQPIARQLWAATADRPADVGRHSRSPGSCEPLQTIARQLWATTADRPAAVGHHSRSPGSCGSPQPIARQLWAATADRRYSRGKWRCCLISPRRAMGSFKSKYHILTKYTYGNNFSSK